MVKAERAFKWVIAIIVIFGILNAFYFLNLVIAFKIAIPVLCVFLIGSILLQSGKGGGLAAIGGLGDQSAFGTRTNTFLTQVTYLVGAAFIVATIFLFKMSIPAKTMDAIVTEHVPSGQHTHDENSAHPEHEGHAHGGTPHAREEKDKGSDLGMQNVGGGNETSGNTSTGLSTVGEGKSNENVNEESKAD